MGLTAEMRFWWPGDKSRELRLWLERLDIEVSSPTKRQDVYFETGDPSVGMKLRGGEKLEVKSQKGKGELSSGLGKYRNFNIWGKRDGAEQSVPPTCQIEIRKQRWLAFLDGKGRNIDLFNEAENGCQIEVSIIEVGDSPEKWTGFCLEAYGEKQQLKPILRLTADRLGELPSIFHDTWQASYPQWLLRFCFD